MDSGGSPARPDDSACPMAALAPQAMNAPTEISPMPPAPSVRPRTWFESEALLEELTGRPLELGWLELVVPAFRVAHISVDTDGRQVGESNVFPPALRIAVPTSWRTCTYSGSRHQTERPMNVSALKASRVHWPQMMRVLSIVRGKYLQRVPRAREGWTVGDLHRLATLVLAVPTYALMRDHDRVANGALHPVLSSLFRVTDGLRMTMHQMLFGPTGKPVVPPQSPTDAAGILEYAERNHSFHSEHGVCAGPQAMIEEFLALVVDGRVPPAAASVNLDEAVRDALTDLDATTDYAFLGLRVHAAVFSLGPAMTRSYDRLAMLADQAAAHGVPQAGAAQRRLAERMRTIHQCTFLAPEQWCLDRDAVYADMFERCGEGLGLAPHANQFAAQLAIPGAAADPGLVAALRASIGRYLGAQDDRARAWVHEVADEIATFAQRVQAILATACEVQTTLNLRIGRPAPRREFEATDLDIHHRLQGSQSRTMPCLLDEIADLFGVRLRIDRKRIAVEAPSQDASIRSGVPTFVENPVR